MRNPDIIRAEMDAIIEKYTDFMSERIEFIDRCRLLSLCAELETFN